MNLATATTTAAPAAAGPAPPDTAAHELAGEVLSVYPLKEDFCRVMLRDRRQLVGEVEADDIASLPGVTYRFFGVWKEHARFGWQFNFDGYSLAAEQTADGIRRYLSKCDLPLERRDITALVRQFGLATLSTLREDPAAAVAAGILTEDVAGQVASTLHLLGRLEAPRLDLFQLFAGHGFTAATVKGCLRTWAADAPRVVRRDPFTMLVSQIEGVGFARADELYQALGHPIHRLKRQMLAGWYSLLTDGDGNTWERREVIAAAMLKSIGFERYRGDQAIELGLRASWLRERDGYLAVAERASSEAVVASHVARLLKSPPVWAKIPVPQGEMSDHQFAAVRPLLASGIGVLAGTPGTGKTHTAAALLREALRLIPQHKIAVCAPTGKAAVRITAAMQRYKLPLTATTIHRLLMGGPESGFVRNEGNALDVVLVIVDETSMVDTDLMAALLSALPRGCNLLLVGDPYQLAPVGHGAPLRDIMAAGVPTALLTEIRRNAGLIVEACRDIKDGRPWTYTDGPVTREPAVNLKLLPVDDPAQQVDLLLRVLERVGEYGLDPIWEVQVVVPRNDDTEVSRKRLNPLLQKLLNPPRDGTPADQANEKYRVGDKLICLRNQSLRAVEPVTRITISPREMSAAALDSGAIEEELRAGNPLNVGSYRTAPAQQHYIANGDQGRVLAASPTKVVVEFQFPTRLIIIEEKPATSKDFDHAYAITVHKCVHPDTLVETAEGLLPIRMIKREGTIAMAEGPKNYANFVHNPTGYALRIVTKRGYEITVTPDHKVEAYNLVESKYSPYYARQLRNGDWVRMRLGVTVDPEGLADLPAKPTVHPRAIEYKVPAYVTNEVAEFFGLMVADGTLYDRGFRLVKRHADVTERFNRLCGILFDAEPKPVSIHGTDGFEVSSSLLAEWLRLVGGMHPNAKEIPECILRSPSWIHAAFLRGLFEDGGVNMKGDLCDHIEWSTCYPGMAETVQVMLLRLGMVSTKTLVDGQHKIYLYGRNAGVFREKIGFVAAYKNSRLANCIETENKYTLPVSRGEADSLVATCPIKTAHNARIRKTVSRATARMAGWSERLAWFEDTIQSIERVRCESMCVEVWDGHRFLQNGFPWWNSQGSEYPLVIVMVDKNAYGVLSREWIYTAISRASQMCVVIGERGRTMRCVLKVGLQRRKTFLRELIDELRDGAGRGLIR